MTNRHILTLAGLLVGAIVGYLYYHQVGCISVSCGITANPFNSSVYGALLGGLLFTLFEKKVPESSQDPDGQQRSANT